MLPMTTTVPLSPLTSLTERLWYIVTRVRVIVAARGRDRAQVPMVMLVYTRIGRLAARFEALVAGILAGRVYVPSIPRARAAHAASLVVGRPEKALRLPVRDAWLVRWTLETVAFRGFLEVLMADPEMEKLLAVDPRVGRILRPLCRMLGGEYGPLVALPADRKLAPRKSQAGRKRKRVVKPVVPKGPPPSAMAVIFAAMNPGVAIWPEIKPPKWKPPWFSIGR
jgi:hypothetical protein